MKSLTAFLLLALLPACAGEPLRDCDKPYASTLPQCAKPKPRKCDCVTVCNDWGRCVQVPRDQIRRVLQGVSR
jgi:hypothetical protein